MVASGTAFVAAADAVYFTVLAAGFFAGIVTAALGARLLVTAGIAAGVSAAAGTIAFGSSDT